MRSWTITESSITELEGFEIGWLPTGAYNYLTPQIKHTRGGNEIIALESGPFVGTLPLINGDVLRIAPRAGEKALWRMLLLSEGLAEQMKREFDEFTQISFTETGSASWLSLLARSYFEQLRLIEKNSLRSERVIVNRRLASARGRVRLLPTLVSLARRESLPVHCRYKERTYQTVEHRVLSAGALRLREVGSVEPENKDLSLRWAGRLKGRLKEYELREVIAGLRTKRYTGSRAYYIPALLMARLLLVEAGIALDEDASVSSEAFLTNIRTLFERYVRAVVRDAVKDKGFIVEKREDNPRTLFEDGTCSLIPDVMVSNVEGVKLILDAKYKIDKPIAEPDYYQMAAYLNTYDVPQGVLILPTLHDRQSNIASHRTFSGLTIYEMRVPLDDWNTTEQFLTKEVRQLLGLY
jgi:5-methylcytosine-specific restriction endonuclease McrBC regulatory subunit McrC